MAHEKELINVPDIVSVNTNLDVRLGTLSDKLQAGFSLTLGRFHSPFTTLKSSNLRNFQSYAYSQPLVSLVGYDATMQGGIFNRTSPYMIKSADINRITFQNNFGIVVNVWKLYAEYYRTYLSKEFQTGKEHRWGGVKIGMSFQLIIPAEIPLYKRSAEGEILSIIRVKRATHLFLGSKKHHLKLSPRYGIGILYSWYINRLLN